MAQGAAVKGARGAASGAVAGLGGVVAVTALMVAEAVGVQWWLLPADPALVVAMGLATLPWALLGIGIGAALGAALPGSAALMRRLGALMAGLGLVLAVPVFLVKRPPRALGEVTGEAREGAPDVVFVVIDTLRADAVDDRRFGVDLAPNLRALGREGTVYADASSPSSWSWPATSALLTGRYPGDIGTLLGPLPDDAHTLAEQLAAHGYATAGFSDNLIVSEELGYGQGFTHFHQRNAAMVAKSYRPFAGWSELAQERTFRWLGMMYRGAAEVNEAVVGWLGAQEGPVFVYVHYMDPHYPYYPHPEDPENVGLRADPVHFVSYAPLNDRMYTEPFPRRLDVTPEQAENLVVRYLGEVQAMDARLGELLAALRARPRWEDTVVVVTSDHGEEFLEHGLWGHGHSLREHQVRVPLVLRGPGVASGEVVEAPVSTIGIGATLLELAGVPAIDGMEPGLGEGALRAETVRRKEAFHMLREGASKVVRVAPQGRPEEGSVRAWDVEADPGERAPVGAPAGMAERLEAWALRGTREADALGEEERAQLRALGYLDE